jgi:hypothetical protein
LLAAMITASICTPCTSWPKTPGNSQRTLEQLVWRLDGRRPYDLTIEQLLELDDNNLRHALEALALSRNLWTVRPDRRWLELAQTRPQDAAVPPDDNAG